MLLSFVCDYNRSLSSVLSDLPDAAASRPPEMDFTEGMKNIYDALHSEEDETVPTLMLPYRGRRFGNSNNNLTSRLYGRQ